MNIDGVVNDYMRRDLYYAMERIKYLLVGQSLGIVFSRKKTVMYRLVRKCII